MDLVFILFLLTQHNFEKLNSLSYLRVKIKIYFLQLE